MAAAAETGEGSVDKGELTLEADIIQACDKLGRALRVLVIDDEAVYRGGLAAYLSRTTELEAAILLAQADGSEAAFIAVGAEGFDLIITDVDMGNDSLDGFALVRKFRAGGHAGMICVHSNRIVAADHKRAIEAGADAFLPKPMARAQLLRLVLQAVQSASVPFVEPAIESIVPRQGAVAADTLPKPEILVVDDNPFILDAWEDVLKADAIVHVFTGLEDLSDRLEADPSFADRLVAAITDMHLDGSAGDGLDVGRFLKKSRPGLPVLLSSDATFSDDELLGVVDRVIAKEPISLKGLGLGLV
jgi:CheY-like chemotaxis protein